MIIGIGLDVLEVARFARALDSHGERLARRIFTIGELAQCEKRRDRVLALAARFAAKEACLKALGTGRARGISFHEVKVARLDGGAPQMLLSGRAAERARELGVRRVHVSLTHQPGVAAAVVVLEG